MMNPDSWKRLDCEGCPYLETCDREHCQYHDFDSELVRATFDTKTSIIEVMSAKVEMNTLMFEHYVSLLTNVTDKNGQKIGNYFHLPAKDRGILTIKYNESVYDVEYDHGYKIPMSVAVEFTDGSEVEFKFERDDQSVDAAYPTEISIIYLAWEKKGSPLLDIYIERLDDLRMELKCRWENKKRTQEIWKKLRELDRRRDKIIDRYSSITAPCVFFIVLFTLGLGIFIVKKFELYLKGTEYTQHRENLRKTLHRDEMSPKIYNEAQVILDEYDKEILELQKRGRRKMIAMYALTAAIVSVGVRILISMFS